MLGIRLNVIHEWRPGHADPLTRIERMIEVMNDITNRLTASVESLAIALGNQTSAIAVVATAIRNHPASTTDSGALSSLADRLDGITASLNTSTAELQQLSGEENIEDGLSEPPVEPEPPVDQLPEPAPPVAPEQPVDQFAGQPADPGTSDGQEAVSEPLSDGSIATDTVDADAAASEPDPNPIG